MTNFLIFVLATAGLTKILTQGSVFDKIRPKNKFFRCPMCVGFYIGLILFTAFWVCGIHLISIAPLGAVLFPFIGSISSFILCTLVDDNGLKSSRTMILRSEKKR